MALDDVESGNLPDVPTALRVLAMVAWSQGYQAAQVDHGG
jgi:hypothetical protein